MKFNRQCPMFLLAGLLFLSFLFSSGCATTPARRARRMPEVIEALPSEDKERILAGEIAIGDSPEMVYLAWGEPDRITSIVREGEEIERWSYLGYRREYLDTFPARHSFDRWYYDRDLGHYGLLPSPYFNHPHAATYRVSYVRRRVEFRDDAVIAIEQIRQ